MCRIIRYEGEYFIILQNKWRSKHNLGGVKGNWLATIAPVFEVAG
jgi:hypothetical protein